MSYMILQNLKRKIIHIGMFNNMEAQFSRLEHQAYTLGVGGSSPSASTEKKQNKMKLFGASNSLGTAELEKQKRIRKEIEQRWLRMCGTIERVESDESITDLYEVQLEMNKCVCGGKVDTLVLGTSSSECEFESHQTHKGATTD